MNEEIMDIFAGICREVVPHIDAIAEALKRGGAGSGAMLYLTGDGYFHFTANDFGGYRLLRIKEGENARIEYLRTRKLSPEKEEKDV